MNRKALYTIVGLTLLIVGLVVWKFLPTLASNKSNSSLEIVEASSHKEIDEHGPSEENVIFLSPEQIKELGIQTRRAEPGYLSVTLSTRGKIILQPDRLTHILPKISGIAIEAHKNIGDHVKEGDLLAILESREMADIKAGYLVAKEKESLALALSDREKRLYEKKVSAEQDYLNAKSSYQEARINVQLAEQKLHAFGLEEEEIKGLFSDHNPDLRIYEIRSPVDGVVIARHITKGEFVENTTRIYEIADLSTIWIEIGIYPKDLASVKEGQMVDVSLPVEGNIAKAKIIYLSPIIQDETITAKAVAEMQTPNENWRPGSFVKVDIAIEKISSGIVIANEAVQNIDGKPFVFVKIPEGFEKRQVTLGVRDDKNVEVLSGLRAGDEYAFSKTFLLKADLSKKEAEHAH